LGSIQIKNRLPETKNKMIVYTNKQGPFYQMFDYVINTSEEIVKKEWTKKNTIIDLDLRLDLKIIDFQAIFFYQCKKYFK